MTIVRSYQKTNIIFHVDKSESNFNYNIYFFFTLFLFDVIKKRKKRVFFTLSVIYKSVAKSILLRR